MYNELQNIEHVSKDGDEMVDSSGDAEEQDGSLTKLKVSQKTENFTDGAASLSLPDKKFIKSPRS